jgi:hypothetical protein
MLGMSGIACQCRLFASRRVVVACRSGIFLVVFGANLVPVALSAQTSPPVSAIVGVTGHAYSPPPNVPGVTAWLPVTQIYQEPNLCVDASAAMVLTYFGTPHSQRELKVWSRGQEFDPRQPFNDFTDTRLKDLVDGLARHGIHWRIGRWPNDAAGLSQGLAAIKQQIDQGNPVLVSTNLYAGHVFVVAGYDSTRNIMVAVDPNILPPGIRELSPDDFAAIWNGSRSGHPDQRAATFTSR